MSEALPLVDIQKLQFKDKAQAEKYLLEFLRKCEDPKIEALELMPKPESLNSINGFIKYANGDRFFFKAHVEENEQIEEYYNSELLAGCGYPVIAAKRVKQHPGQQIAIYEILSYPTLFDIVKTEEDKILSGAISTTAPYIVQAQENLEKNVSAIYKNTCQEINAETHARAPVHQLFYHRLQEDGRVGVFYRGKTIRLSDGSPLSFDKLANMRWTVNGAAYDCSLNDVIEQARRRLKPESGISIIGHGDAHNGNIFVAGEPGAEELKLFMFDPAFAGRHDPILDLTKPLFHNIFARWMYFADQVENEFDLTCKINGERITIEHSYELSSLRMSFLDSKVRYLIAPTIDHLRSCNVLRHDWKDYLRSALFCCAFLTVNLFADSKKDGTLAERYGSQVKLLGLAMAVELSQGPHNGSSPLSCVIDNLLSASDIAV